MAKKRYQAVAFPYNRTLKLRSSKVIRIDVPVLSVSWSVEDHSVIIQALRKGLIELEASDTGGVPRWKSSCPDRLAEATDTILRAVRKFFDLIPGVRQLFIVQRARSRRLVWGRRGYVYRQW